MKVTKAVIPAAGLGTRVLPATKAMPKEMIPLVDKPAIQYIVEEAVNSGIKDILIILNRGKGIIEDHFDRFPELEHKLEEGNKKEILDNIIGISRMANIYFIRQKETKGLGHAINCSKSFVGNEPFAVLFGDDVIVGKEPACLQLMKAYEEFGLGVIGAKKVSEEDISKYGSLKINNIRENYYMCTDMIEKPTKDKVMSLYSIMGRCILTPDIFDILDRTEPGIGGEIQLTDAMKVQSREKGMIAVDFSGKRYDIGNKLGTMQASVEIALKHPEIGEQFKAYLRDLIKEL